MKSEKVGIRLERRLLFRILVSLRYGWTIVGIALLLLVIVDTLIYLLARDSAAPIVQLVRTTALPDARANATEIGAEFFESNGSPWQPGKLRWQPYVYWRASPYQGKWVTVDQTGLRRTVGASVEQNSPPGKSIAPLRIFCFGGSTMWGTLVRDAHTIPSELAKLIGAAGFPAEITNFGQPGYASTQELIALNLELQSGNIPDIVIFYDGFNDIGATLMNRHSGLAADEFRRGIQDDLLRRTSLASIGTLLVAHSSISRLFRPSTKDELISQMAETLHSADPTTVIESIGQCYIANMKLAHAVCDAHSAPVVFFWQPIVFSRSSAAPAEKAIVDENNDNKQFYRLVYEMMQNHIRDNINDPLISRLHYLGDAFDRPVLNGTAFFWDRCHVSEAGNAIIADRIMSHLLPIIRSRTKTRL